MDRAVAFGWPRARVLVIDDDLWQSGQSAEGRLGFQRLLAELALDRVGLILGWEMSRLARSCKDWHQLLELCARFRTLLADADGLEDPTDYNDRLLLGRKGTMSEAELHIFKERMYQGKLNKARRGERSGPPPIGYVRSAGGRRRSLRTNRCKRWYACSALSSTARGRCTGCSATLVPHGIRLPVRPHGGPNRGQLEWRRPSRETLQNLLPHPIYAGAYRHGQRACDPRRQQPGRPGTGRQCLAPEDCLVLIRDPLPAYITWDRFCANQERLAANRASQEAAGAPRAGAALLGGLLRCGRCGRRMLVRQGGPKHRPWYGCTRGASDYGEPLCQSLSGLVLDELVAQQMLAAVAPAALEASLAAVAEVERERAELTRHWQVRLERAQYETERAARPFQACAPENRLVARALERRWEEALRHQRQREEEFERWQRTAVTRLSASDRDAIRGRAADLPAMGRAETTTPAARQRLARLLLERVAVTVDKKSEQVEVRLHWAGGLVGTHTLQRPVSRYDQQADYPRLVQRLRELCQERLSSATIAARLNSAGFRPPKRAKRFTGSMVLRLTAHRGLARRARHGSPSGLGKNEYRPTGLARKLGVSRDTVRRWLRVGWLNVRQDADGQHVIWADASELRRLRALHRLPRTWANRARLAELQKPKQRPAR